MTVYFAGSSVPAAPCDYLNCFSSKDGNHPDFVFFLSNVLTTIGHIAMVSGTYINGDKRINPNDFGDPTSKSKFSLHHLLN